VRTAGRGPVRREVAVARATVGGMVGGVGAARRATAGPPGDVRDRCGRGGAGGEFRGGRSAGRQSGSRRASEPTARAREGFRADIATDSRGGAGGRGG